MPNSLNVYFKDKLVGKLELKENSQNFTFNYTDSWKRDGFAISPHIGFDTVASSGTIKKFLDNLLPEGKGLEVFTLFFHITKNNTLALTREIGNETSGALSFFEDEIKQVQTSIRAIDKRELTNRIKIEDPIQLIIWDGRPRLSVAGVQNKLPIIYHEGAYSFGEGKLASTHILKFETDRQRHLVINEYICMKLAKLVNLDVAEVELQRFDEKPALLVKRFDRVRISDSEVQRVHIIDGCQALDLAPTHKYERNFGSGRDVKHIREGVSFKKLFDFSNSCKNPIKTKLSMLRWAFFNLIISNSDAHGKNISFFADPSGYHLTPYYDLVSIAMYPEFEQELSMAYGDDFSIDIRAYQIALMCQECEINQRLASKELKNMAVLLKEAVQSIDVVDVIINKDEQKFADKLLKIVLQRAEKYEDIAGEIVNIEL
jgi:serine/threonine-protein kinase HipA